MFVGFLVFFYIHVFMVTKDYVVHTAYFKSHHRHTHVLLYTMLPLHTDFITHKSYFTRCFIYITTLSHTCPTLHDASST